MSNCLVLPEIVTSLFNCDKGNLLLDLEEDEEEEYHFVGSQEADPMDGKISDESPFGKAMLGKKVGDVVEVEAPIGIVKYEILKIEK